MSQLLVASETISEKYSVILHLCFWGILEKVECLEESYMGQDSRTSKPVRSARFSANVHSDDFLVLGMCVLRVNAFVENDVTVDNSVSLLFEPWPRHSLTDAAGILLWTSAFSFFSLLLWFGFSLSCVGVLEEDWCLLIHLLVPKLYSPTPLETSNGISVQETFPRFLGISRWPFVHFVHVGLCESMGLPTARNTWWKALFYQQDSTFPFWKGVPFWWNLRWISMLKFTIFVEESRSLNKKTFQFSLLFPRLVAFFTKLF